MSTEKKTADLFSLKGRLAVVTGGSGEKFAAQAVTALAEQGAEVVITSRARERAEERAKYFCSRGLKVRGFALDLTSEKDINQFAEKMSAEYGALDILVNNAATNHLGDVEEIKLEDWNRVLQTNVTGTMLVTRALAPQMRKSDMASVIMLSSIYGLVSPNPSVYGDTGIDSPLIYGVTKAALLQMTRFLACHWAPKIRVNAITPGGLFANQPEEFVLNYNRLTPLGRMAGPDDLKGAVAFLASQASAWVTGHNLVVDGGWTAW